MASIPCINSRIRTNNVWSCLTEEEVELLNRRVVCREFLPGETVFLEGDPCKGLYLIQSGLVGIRKMDRDGNSSLIRLAGEGDTMGYRPFLANQPHRASGEVIEPARVCRIDAPTVRTILQNNHELALKFLERTARALGEADERIFELAALAVDVRVIHLLVLYHDKWGSPSRDGSVAIELPISRRDLASMIGAHPDSVTRAIRQLASRGLVHVEGRRIRNDEFDDLANRLHTDLARYHN